MEGLTVHHGICLKDLLSRARRLSSSALSLSVMFAEEANRLSRWDEASRLRAVHHAIMGQLEQLKRSESFSSYADSRANLKLSLFALGIRGAIAMISRDKQVSAISDHILGNLDDGQRPFGMVLVCIGPGGLPDDVEAISISRLARESNQRESKIINRLQERGYLLLNEQAFSLLIDRLFNDVREGRLRLPVSREKLSSITALGRLKPVAENQK